MRNHPCLFVAVTVLLSGCGASNSAQHIVPSLQPNGGGTQTVAFSISVPHEPAARGRRPAYVSAGTQSALITVTPGNTTATIACAAVCTGTIAAPVGLDTFAVALYDQPNAAGAVLSQGSTTQTIVANQANAVTMSFDPVVKTFALALTAAKMPAGTVATNTLTLKAFDAAGKQIVGAAGTYLDATGKALTVTLSKSDDTNNGAGSGSTTIAPSTITGPGATAATIAYNGGQLLSSTYSAVVSGGASYTVAPVTMAMTPTLVAEFPTGGNAALLNTGPDGNLWFGLNSKNSIGRMTTGGVITTFPTASQPRSFTRAPNGDLWYTTYGNSVGKMTTAGTATDGIVTAAAAHIVVLADGNIWLTDTGGSILNTTIAKPTIITTYALPTPNPYPVYIVLGPDGNIWFSEFLGKNAGRITPAGVITEFALPGPMGGMTVGPDGKIWFTQRASGDLGSMSTTAPNAVTTFTPPVAGDAWELVSGADGNLWYAEQHSGGIVQATPAGKFLSRVVIPAAAGEIDAMVAGPDGNIWFTEWNGAIGKIVW